MTFLLLQIAFLLLLVGAATWQLARWSVLRHYDDVTGAHAAALQAVHELQQLRADHELLLAKLAAQNRPEQLQAPATGIHADPEDSLEPPSPSLARERHHAWQVDGWSAVGSPLLVDPFEGSGR